VAPGAGHPNRNHDTGTADADRYGVAIWVSDMGKKQRRKAARAAQQPAIEGEAAAAEPRAPAEPRGAAERPKAAAAGPQRRPGTRARRKKGSPLPWIVGIGAVVLLVGITVATNVIREANLPGERFRSQGNVHVALGTETPPYSTDPPTSGWHTPGIAAWGAYLDDPPHDQELVHNMEDGGVILWYAAGSREENEEHVAALQNVLGGRWARTVIVPREGLEPTYALTAWTRMQRFEEIDPEGMRAFIAAFHGIDNHQ
jgi:hypothetical protein